MTDNLRDRIAAVLKEHQDESGAGPDCTCGWEWQGYGLWKDCYAGHVADAILAIPGIAVVELPEPAEAVRCWPALVGGEPESVYLAQGEVIVSGGLRLYADEARDLAAALLAAADYAERDQ